MNTWLDRGPLVIWGSVWGPQMAIVLHDFLLTVLSAGVQTNVHRAVRAFHTT